MRRQCANKLNYSAAAAAAIALYYLIGVKKKRERTQQQKTSLLKYLTDINTESVYFGFPLDFSFA